MIQKKIEWSVVLQVVEQEIDFHKNGAPKATKPRHSAGFIEGMEHLHELLKSVREAEDDPNCEVRRPKHIDFLVLSIPTRLLKTKELPSGRDVIKAINAASGASRGRKETTKRRSRDRDSGGEGHNGVWGELRVND